MRALWARRLDISFYFFSRSLFSPIWESIFGRLGFVEPGFRLECIAKTNFSQKSFVMDIEVEFTCFFDALGAVFLVFAAMETGLKIDGFSVV